MYPIALLASFKLRNSVRTVLSDPRKLIPLIIFILIMVGFGGLYSLSASQPAIPGAQQMISGDVFTVGVKIAILFIAYGFIGAGLGDGLLAFGPSDVDYLFPSPIPRRAVLFYRLPALMFNSLFTAAFLLFAFGMISHLTQPKLPLTGHTIAPAWASPVALYFCGGIYLNLAMYVSMKVVDRKVYQRLHTAGLIGGMIGVGGIGMLFGAKTLGEVINSPIVYWTFLPASLSSQALLDGYAKLPVGGSILWLAVGYVISLIPVLTSNANWYEQSIASTERRSTVVNAARGGYASLMATRASSFKYQSDRLYTIRPFGQGAVALFWAHLCAAGKRPWANFLVPVLGGIGVGVFGAVSAKSIHGDDMASQMLGLAGIGFFTVYGSLGFMTTAKTASESANRRRELIGPLPIKGWKTVVANLGTPFVSGTLFFIGVSATYAALQGPFWLPISVGIAVLMPLRLAARMALQYLIGVIYADAADKIQQFFAIGVYGLLAMPFMIGEVIVAVPGILLRSYWISLAAVTLVQFPLILLFFFLAGKATEQAIASGEPVRLWGLLKRA